MGKTVEKREYNFNLKNGKVHTIELTGANTTAFYKELGSGRFTCAAGCEKCVFDPSLVDCGKGFYWGEVDTITLVGDKPEPKEIIEGDIVTVKGMEVIKIYENCFMVKVATGVTAVPKENTVFESRPVKEIEYTISCTKEVFDKVEELLKSEEV